ncbi:hypothetical protein MYCTH_95391, partial [Thermothelomyces thermophilus ATCC 42464]
RCRLPNASALSSVAVPALDNSLIEYTGAVSHRRAPSHQRRALERLDMAKLDTKRGPGVPSQTCFPGHVAVVSTTLMLLLPRSHWSDYSKPRGRYDLALGAHGTSPIGTANPSFLGYATQPQPSRSRPGVVVPEAGAELCPTQVCRTVRDYRRTRPNPTIPGCLDTGSLVHLLRVLHEPTSTTEKVPLSERMVPYRDIFPGKQYHGNVPTLSWCLPDSVGTCFSVPAKEGLADYGNIGRPRSVVALLTEGGQRATISSIATSWVGSVTNKPSTIAHTSPAAASKTIDSGYGS